MKKLQSNFPNSRTLIKNGRYNESVLLGIEEYNKPKGLNKSCPICSTINFIAFKSPIKDRDGNKVISRINWVECRKCHVSYSLT
jgi:hypothetical protein